MTIAAKELPCDGCGRPASPEHIKERIRRLELSTKFRPIHISVLFVAYAPPMPEESAAGGSAESGECGDSFLSALISRCTAGPVPLPSPSTAAEPARLAEFQHRGYYLAYMSECPIPPQAESANSVIARLAPTLIRRIRFNYKPKQIALLGPEMGPLLPLLRAANVNVGPVLTCADGQPLPDPRTTAGQWEELFQRSVATAVAPGETLATGYDRLELTGSD